MLATRRLWEQGAYQSVFRLAALAACTLAPVVARRVTVAGADQSVGGTCANTQSCPGGASKELTPTQATQRVGFEELVDEVSKLRAENSRLSQSISSLQTELNRSEESRVAVERALRTTQIELRQAKDVLWEAIWDISQRSRKQAVLQALVSEFEEARRRAEHEAVANSLQCVVCLEPGIRAGMAMHQRPCFEGFARTQLEQDAAQVHMRSARLYCINQLPELGGCDGHFTEQTIARMLSAELHEVYMEQLRSEIRAQEHTRAHDALNRLAEDISRSIPGIGQEVLERQLNAALPEGRQCGRCGLGPVVHMACADLSAHHGERTGSGTINNACQGCGWFSRDIRHWPPWNGRLPSVALPSMSQPLGLSLAERHDELVARRVAREEEDRFAQIESDARLARQLEGRI